MTFKNDIAEDLTTTFFNTDEFAEEVEYTPYGDAPRTITVLDVSADYSTLDDPSPGDKKFIQAMVSDVPTPKRKDVYEINGETWYFLKTDRQVDNDTVVLILTRSGWEQI